MEPPFFHTPPQMSFLTKLEQDGVVLAHAVITTLQGEYSYEQQLIYLANAYLRSVFGPDVFKRDVVGVFQRKENEDMKVPKEQIGNRLEGEYMESGLSKNEQFKHRTKIIDIELQEGEFGERFVILFDPPYKKGNLVSLNRTSMKRLVSKWGDETDNWINKAVIVRAEKVRGLKNALVDAVTVSPA